MIMDFLENLLSNQNGQFPNRQNTTHRIIQLRKKRDALKNQLKNIDKLMTDNNVLLEESKEPETRELLAVKDHHQELSTLLDCYRLTGFSVFSVEETNIIFSYDTSFKGVSQETFYLEIEDLGDKQFRVLRHSFPSFVPVLELERSYLKVSLQQFLLRLQDHLYAFITRRGEVKYVQENNIATVTSYSMPYDFIQIKIGQSQDILQLELQLSYTDLLTTLPSKCRLEIIFNDDSETSLKQNEDVIRQWKKILQTDPLSDALADIIVECNKLASSVQ